MVIDSYEGSGLKTLKKALPAGLSLRKALALEGSYIGRLLKASLLSKI